VSEPFQMRVSAGSLRAAELLVEDVAAAIVTPPCRDNSRSSSWPV
jgi:hypothetical protein